MIMTARPWLLCLIFAAFACDSGSGASPGHQGSDEPSTAAPDSGASVNDDSDEDGDELADSGTPAQPEAPSDAGPAPVADAGPKDPIRDIIDTVAEFTTCKPEEVNPVIDCFTKTCTADLLALPGCLLDKCAKLIDGLNPKCKECVVAGVKQDTTGLLTSCIDSGATPGSSTGSSGLSF
jgi:hypothetical protein